MDAKSLEMLEFPQVRQIIAGFVAFSASRDLALALEPVADFDQLSLLLKQSEEARRLLTIDAGFSIGGVIDIRETVRLAALGKIIEPRELLQIQQVLAAAADLRSRLRRFEDECPRLWQIAEGIADFRSLEKDILSCISPGGEVLDSASPELAVIRRQVREVREQLLQRLNAIMNSPKGKRIIQEPIITEREGRHVLLVRIEARHEIKGIVHDVSNTGATVFVEPWATIELGNTLREMVNQEQREVDRILGALTIEVGLYDSQISDGISRIARLDLELAKARYARKAKAAEAAIVPFGEGGTSLKLAQARHPLLGEKAVPLSVEIGRDYSVLVITGPNTGGKTVALKTMGLLSLMTLSGLPIPASPDSVIPFFDAIFADIGDEQSIAQTLSTFSWHMGNIVRVIGSVSNRSLVLLDELGTSTDPAEGSALARSILLHFLERHVMAVATTHFNDLKVFAHVTPGLKNASLDFDPVTLTPTYHLTVGTPGGSNALATAARLGLPGHIIERARGMLAKGTEEMETLLANLMAERQKADSLRAEFTTRISEVENTRAELEAELERVKTEARQSFQEERDRIVREAAELNREIRQAAADLRRERTKESVERARQAMAAVRQQLNTETWKPAEESITTGAGPIAAGDRVRLKEANLEGVVQRVLEDTQQVEVQAGATRFRLGIENVEKMVQGQSISAPPPVRNIPPHRPVALELDLRGKRADEIEPLLDTYLNDASLAGLSEVRIIHGVGTGVVRKIGRDFLASHPLVRSFRSGQRGEGGDGATVVSL